MQRQALRRGDFEAPADERVAGVRFEDDRLIVDPKDGRTIAVPLAWNPRLEAATPAQRARWEPAGAGYGIHWPDRRGSEHGGAVAGSAGAEADGVLQAYTVNVLIYAAVAAE